ncbi:MAG: dihydrolipoyl dehydrogenase [Desulfotomaculaceae bacterium]
MASVVQVDVAVLGGGPAGYVAAIRAAQLGATVALIEAREIGGTCLNRGCIPTKALLKSAEVASLVKRAREFGIDARLEAVHWDVSGGRKERIVKSLRLGLEQLLAKNKVQVVRGAGEVHGANSILVNTGGSEVAVHCRKLIITTGSEPALPDIPGIGLENVMTSDEALELQEALKNIAIIGAGAIGLEFATMFNSAGAKVTVVESQDRLLSWEDKEITAELFRILRRQGIAFKLSAGVKEIKKAAAGLELVVEEKGKESAIKTDAVLVAVGRKLRASAPGIIGLGVRLEKGAIVVNEKMETDVPGVYAAGDVVDGKLLAHLAFAEGRVAAENALGYNSRLNYNAVPSCVYTSPEVASVGLSEEECLAKSIDVKTGRFDFRNNGRALCLGEREGFVKVVVDAQTHVILGAQILGAQASEIISEITLAVSLGARAEALAELVHPHPTLSEAVMEACGDAIGRAIHKV